MPTTIHPTATVSAGARIGADCFIGPYCNIGPRVTIGDRNRLEAHVSVGTAAEHRDYFHAEPGAVRIGDDNVIREFVTVNAGTVGETVIESKCVLLRGSHVGHDAIIRQFANLSCNALIGGHSIVGQGANLGLQCALHQHRVIGAYAMIGMCSAITRDVLPFTIGFGVPARPQRINRIGLSRAGVAESDLQKFEAWFQVFDQTGREAELAHAFEKFLKQYHYDRQALGRDAPVTTA